MARQNIFFFFFGPLLKKFAHHFHKQSKLVLPFLYVMGG